MMCVCVCEKEREKSGENECNWANLKKAPFIEFDWEAEMSENRSSLFICEKKGVCDMFI